MKFEFQSLKFQIYYLWDQLIIKTKVENKSFKIVV